MKYLLFFKDGFLKKIPLFKKETIVGRGEGVDYRIDDPAISRRHAKIVKENNHIKVYDLNSSNGLFYNEMKVKKATIKLNDSFKLADTEFYLKEGDTKEFKLPNRFKFFYAEPTDYQTIKFDKTRKSFTIFDKTLNHILQLGLKGFDFENIFSFIITPLENIFEKGILMVLKKQNGNIEYLTKLKINADEIPVPEWSGMIDDIFSDSFEKYEIGENGKLYSYPIKLEEGKGALIFISFDNNELSEEKMEFLHDLSKEITLIYNFYTRNGRKKDDRMEIITKSDKLLKLLKKIKKLSKENINILIEGETGVGKELIAKFIYLNSKQKKGKYVGINCSAIPENLLEDELFGHEKGSFSGAYQKRMGKLELASDGILVLDEIADMPLSLQAKLLRVLQEQEFYRIGGNTPIRVNLRVIALSNKNIMELVERGKFRRDLYYRIAHFTFKIPPLRERKEDIECLINYFIKRFSKNKKNIKGITKDAINILKEYSWPGNIRELKNTIKALIGFSDNDDIIDSDRIVNEIPAFRDFYSSKEKESVKVGEKERILGLLEDSRWNKSSVAKALGISRTALYKKLKKYGIE